MRNLKRALSLTLASVMLLGMMVVGSSAAAGYDDVADTDNVEAIEVLQAIEVMVGDERGFGPERPVNRAEMAVVMGKLLSLDYNYYSTSCPFNDVYDWAQGWVGACAANGIVSGRGEGVYDPGSTVTAVEAASMLMRALGYFKYQNDYADGFEVSTVRQGTIIGIFDGVGSSATEPMTRNQVAQMVLNALQSPVVEPDGNTINLTTPDGTVLTGKVNYVSVTSNKPFARAIGRVGATSIGSTNDGYIVELGERLYDGKLKLNDDYDPFGRPSRNWEYDGKNIGVYAKKELIVFDHVGTVTGKDLYDVLGSKTIEDYKLTVNLDGVSDPKIVRAEAGKDGDPNDANRNHNVDYVFAKNDLNRNNKATIGATGTGVLTQVFVDNEADTIDVVIVNTYLARADKDYDTKKEELAVTAYAITKNTASGEYVKIPKDGTETELFKLAAEDFPAVKDAAKDTAFLLTVAEGEVQSVVPAEVLSAVQISAFKTNDHVVVDGTTYNFDTTAGYDKDTLKVWTTSDASGKINLKDLTYNVYLDTYGNLIGVKEVDAVKNYVFITGIDLNNSNLTNRTADANAIFIDGTMDTIRINLAKSTLNTTGNPAILNTWCTYTKNSSDVYTVTEVISAGNGVNSNAVTADATKVPGGKNNDTKLAQFHQWFDATADAFTIDKKNITLYGGGKQSQTEQNGYNVVYGNKDSVYITAELGELLNDDNAAGQAWGVIKDVENITTGVTNANLEVWSRNDAATDADDDRTGGVKPVVGTSSYGVYTLYNNDGVVIAAVVVGEDNGAARNLVYVHSSGLDYEAYNGSSTSRASGDGLWTWARKVTFNGEEVTLTEVSDSSSYLKKMNQYYWYQVKLNGDGQVIGAYAIAGSDDSNLTSPTGLETAKLKLGKDCTNNYYNIKQTVNDGADTILYYSYQDIYSKLNMVGRTLFVATDDTSGFPVAENVNYVLQQWNSNKKDTFIETGSGADNLASVVKEINDRYNGKNYIYRVSAILENGIASSVVIWDNNNDYVRPGDIQNPNEGNAYIVSSDSALISSLNKSGVEILGSGANTLTLNFSAPDWASGVNETDGDLSFTATLMMDGKAYERVAITSDFSVDGTAATATSPTKFSFTEVDPFTRLKANIATLAIDPTEHTFTVEIGNVVWKNAGVKYALADGTDITADVTGGKTAGVGAANKANFAFTYDIPADATVAAEGATYEISNLRTTASADTLKGAVPDNVAITTIANAYAPANGWVNVTIKGVTLAAAPVVDSYTVNATTTGRKAVEFLKASTTTPVKADIKTTGWGSSVTAKANEYVLIRATDPKATLTWHSSTAPFVCGFDSTTGASLNITGVAQIMEADGVTGTGVWYFKLPGNRTISDVTVTYADNEIILASIYEESSTWKINAKTTKTVAATDTMTQNRVIAELVKAYAEAGKLTGWTFVDMATTVAGGKKDATSITLRNTTLGENVTINAGNFKAGHNFMTAVVDTKTVVIGASSGTDLDALKVAELTTKANYYIKKTAKGANTSTAIAYDVSTNGGTLAEGDQFDTNGNNGYIKLAATTVTVTNNAATNAMTAANFGTVSGALTVADADKFVDTNTYVKTGATGSIKLTAANDNKTVDAGYNVKALVSVTGGTIGGAFGGATPVAVPALAAGQTLVNATGATVTFTFATASAAQASTLTVTLSQEAVPSP